MKSAKTKAQNVAFPVKLFRGSNRLRVAILGMPKSGTSTLFHTVASTCVRSGELTGTDLPYDECQVRVDLNEIDLVHLPAVSSLHDLPAAQSATLRYLLWGNLRPAVAAHEDALPPAPFKPPDALIQVVDATALRSHLELTLELAQLGRPLVIALNMMDQARAKGIHINISKLQSRLGITVVPITAFMGKGITQLFASVLRVVRNRSCPLPPPLNQHIADGLRPLSAALNTPEVHQAFRVPHEFLLRQFAGGDQYFLREFAQHFPAMLPHWQRLLAQAAAALPRPVAEEIHADRHHQAARIAEAVIHFGAATGAGDWRYWLDELFLHPRLGLTGSLLVFALVLFIVFEFSRWLDSISTAWLAAWLSSWQPATALGVIGRGVADGFVGLVGIVVPYMIPLVLLLVALEESGIMHRIAFVVDRWFHHLGLHGGTAVPFLMGLGCNVPALSATAHLTRGRERLIASVLLTFVPCSARSAVILAVAGKYLGGGAVFAIFLLALLLIAVLGKLMSTRFIDTGPGQIQEIPAYAWPRWHSMLVKTWERTSDILTIVTPLLVGGSALLAVLGYLGADAIVNSLFTPVTAWWLGLPLVMGVPLLFGVLRKELSLLMIYQALGTFDVSSRLDWVQMFTLLVFLTFYVPCVSTFAVMLRTIGRRQALASAALSVAVALLISGAIRLLLESFRLLSAV